MACSFIKCFTQRSTRLLGLSLIRRQSTGISAATASPLSILRKKTGFAYSLCREALDKHNNNVQDSENWLKAYALTHGLQRASKLQSRSAKEGLIGLSVTKDHKLVTLLELNCETDFVAKNNIFKEFVLEATKKHSLKVGDISIEADASHSVNEIKFEHGEAEKIKQEVGILVTRLGENVKLGRALRFSTTEDDLRLFCQIHPQAESNITEIAKTELGRVCCILCLRDLYPERNKNGHSLIGEIGNRLCRHVIGYNPDYIELPDAIRNQLEKMQSKQKAEAEKINADPSSLETSSERGELDVDKDQHPSDEWPSLLDQTLIGSDDTIIREFCEANKVEVVYFKRIECGLNSDL